MLEEGITEITHGNQKVRVLNSLNFSAKTRGGGVLPYMGYIGMCGPKGYGFSVVVVINRVSILADFGHSGHKLGMVFCTLALIWVCS